MVYCEIFQETKKYIKKIDKTNRLDYLSIKYSYPKWILKKNGLVIMERNLQKNCVRQITKKTFIKLESEYIKDQ